MTPRTFIEIRKRMTQEGRPKSMAQQEEKIQENVELARKEMEIQGCKERAPHGCSKMMSKNSLWSWQNGDHRHP